ncbi:unnamed protein product [Trifolium pratense]|uniref:Uncharacterized protein n=1 Tax=Trifolium pratense TaxID=57577 RepID=A0ACB0I8Q2_TRIPR|nr:unnamed protein product [Trifolium pratense]
MALQNYTDFPTNSANPYYLHPNENPALVLVSPSLTAKNYHTWSRSMHIALISKNKEKFIDGSLPKPPVSDPLYAPWIRCNTMVLAWIHRSISESIARSVLWIETAAGVWKNLRVRFSQSDIFRISDLQEDMYRFRQGTLDVSDYFTQLKVYWDELENYRPLPYCKCSIPCSCGVIDSVRAYREQDFVIRFLKGLNERFSHSKSQIMMMNPLPDIDRAFSLVIQQEREMLSFNNSDSVSEATSDSAMVMQVNSTKSNSHGKKSFYKGKGQGSSQSGNRVCTHCGSKTNHIVDNCFEKIGYPPGYKTNKFKSSSSQVNNTSSASALESVQQGSSAQSNFQFTQEMYQDGSALGSPGLASCGGIFRDYTATFLAGGVSINIGNSYALHAELIGVMSAIEIAHSKGWNNLWIESDSQLVNLAFKSAHIVPWKFRNRWFNCLTLTKTMHFRATHIYREGNCCADRMAALGININGFY